MVISMKFDFEFVTVLKLGDWFKYHTFGVDQFVENIVIKHGLPPGVSSVQRLGM